MCEGPMVEASVRLCKASITEAELWGEHDPPPKGTELPGSPCRELTGLGRAAHLGVTVGRFLLVRWRNGFKSRLALGGR